MNDLHRSLNTEVEFLPDEEFRPSVEALNILLETFGDTTRTVLRLASSGFHRLNPYHNIKHELQHVYWSHACLMNEPYISADGLTQADQYHLAIASIFHDHNHSGGKKSDAENIQIALQILPVVANELAFLDGSILLNQDVVTRLIQVTQYNKRDGFEKEPTTCLEQCMRDADLMSIYTEEGRDLLIGLYSELGMDLQEMKTSELNAALDANAEFLRNAKMYTFYGIKMKEYYLDDCLKFFADQVRASL